MAFESGSRIGPYEIQSALGAGAVGEVYRARDTRVGRIVAIKVLGAAAIGRSNARERFAREAKVLAGLNHPNICNFYDIGEHEGLPFLVMEYLEGETLASRLRRTGALSIDHALRHAIEIAAALEHAHRCGLVHRDLKPSNVMLTRSGAKLLDFGVAKRGAPVLAGGSASGGLDPTASLTVDAAIVGTPSYMAPEQLHGAPVDARTDIFAYGQLVYEMVTGRRAFEGTSQASVIVAILERSPEPFSANGTVAPPLLESVVMRCLAKAPDERWQTAGDLRKALTWAAEGSSQTARISPPGRARRHVPRFVLMTAAMVALAIFALIAALVVSRRESRTTHAIRFVLLPPEEASFTPSSAFMAVSPDGRSVAFVASLADGKIALWVRALDSLTARQLAIIAGGQPFWSPDSRFIGFFADGKLEKIDAAGGLPRIVADAEEPRGAWNRDDVIVFKPHALGGLYRIAASGGVSTPVTIPEGSLGELSHDWPQFLPDNRHFLYLARSSNPEHDGIAYVGSLDSSTRLRLFKSDSQVVYSPPGVLLYMLGSTLLAQPFDAASLRVTGDPMPIAEQVERNPAPGSRRGAFSVSGTGVLAYRSTVDRELVWFDRTGKRLNAVAPPGQYSNPALSPDQMRVAVARLDVAAGTRDLWLIELARGVVSRFSVGALSDDMPVWSPDGSRILFKSQRGAAWGFYQRSASASGAEERVLAPVERSAIPLSWSDGGHLLLYSARSDPAIPLPRNLWTLHWPGDHTPIAGERTRFDEPLAQASPDGRWMAYVSDESGHNEVYVRPFRSATAKWQVSVGGGSEPSWRGDGRELYYLAANKDLMAVAVRSGSSFDAGSPMRLFGTAVGTGFINTSYTRNQYVPAADGRRFLLNQGTGSPSAAPVTVVVNWTSMLKQ